MIATVPTLSFTDNASLFGTPDKIRTRTYGSEDHRDYPFHYGGI